MENESKTGKGWYESSKEEGYLKSDGKTLTLEGIMAAIERAFKENSPQAFEQYCFTHGFVYRDSTNLNLCNNPECPSCSQLSKLVEQEIKDSL